MKISGTVTTLVNMFARWQSYMAVSYSSSMSAPS